MRRTLVPLASLAVAAVLLVAGCSSSDSSSSGSGSGPASGSSAKVDQADIDALAKQAGVSGKVNVEAQLEAAPKSGSIETELDDFYFGPAFIKAKPGSTVKVELHNEGSVAHTFTIDSAHVDETLKPDAKMTVTVKVPSSGSLQYYCRFHRAQGMQGGFVSDSSS
ncbi:MAG: cupredoxin domain-containing protein [Acidimicrobiia bacterium]|nr:cupredoxin domain-containing protein [Acidimicrobiia bacterium]